MAKTYLTYDVTHKVQQKSGALGTEKS